MKRMFAKNLMFILGIACGVHVQAASTITIYDIRDRGAKCDNRTDDAEAIKATFLLAAGKGAVYIPASTVKGGACLASTEIAYNVATGGPITVFGDGPNSVLKASGDSNKVLHFTGTAGVTSDPVLIQNLSLQSATSATSSALIHLDGIAHWLIEGVWADGKNKANNCFQMTAAQQGQVSGGEALNCTTGAHLESKLDGNEIRSNGIDWHGMTFFNSTTNFKISHQAGAGNYGADGAGADDVFFHGNHLTSAIMQIDAYGGAGMLVFSNNHLEPVTASNSGMIIRRGMALITGNSFFGLPMSIDINLSATTQAKVIGNLT